MMLLLSSAGEGVGLDTSVVVGLFLPYTSCRLNLYMLLCKIHVYSCPWKNARLCVTWLLKLEGRMASFLRMMLPGSMSMLAMLGIVPMRYAHKRSFAYVFVCIFTYESAWVSFCAGAMQTVLSFSPSPSRISLSVCIHCITILRPHSLTRPLPPHSFPKPQFNQKNNTKQQIFQADPDATYYSKNVYDLATLEPVVAKPHSPDNKALARECRDIKVGQIVCGKGVSFVRL